MLVRKKSRKASSSKAEETEGITRTISQATDLGRSPSMLPPRAAPPTPRRAGRKNHDDGYPQAGAPQITLHSPSPPRAGTAAYLPSPSRISSPNMPLSPVVDSLNLPAITVPDLKDDKMQQFFHQIVEHLNAMEIRAAMAGATPLLRSGLYPGTTAAPPSTPASVEFTKQRQRAYDSQYGSTSSSDTREPLSPAMSDSEMHHGQFGELGKENQYLSVNGTGIMKKSSLRSNDTDSRRTPLRVQIIEPSPRKLRRKKSFDTHTMVSPAFSDSSFSLPSTPRRRWLGNVFKFKPASYHLLSVHDGFTSREECRRLLVGLGVKVLLTHAEGTGVLKCKFDEVKDPASVQAVVKAVRFRVEVQKPTTQQAMAGYQVAMHLIQEKGASSSFQMLYYRLKRVWELDISRTPMGAHSPMFSPALTDGGRFSETLVYVD